MPGYRATAFTRPVGEFGREKARAEFQTRDCSMAGINLQNVAVGVISVVNPQRKLSIALSNGNTVNPDGTVTPSYLPIVTGIYGQVQPLQYTDIQLIAGLNLQGTRRKLYINGALTGLQRNTLQGGDLITTLDDGNVYLVAVVAEQWPDWCSVICTLQTDSSLP